MNKIFKLYKIKGTSKNDPPVMSITKYLRLIFVAIYSERV